MLLGQAAGSWSAGRSAPGPEAERPPDPDAPRALGLAPALLALSRQPALVLAAASLVAAGSFWCGRQEARARRSRRDARAARTWEPSRAAGWDGTGAVRITGWCRVRADAWSGPAVLVATGRMAAAGPAVAPLRGDGILLRGRGPPPWPGAILVGRLELRAPDGLSVWGGFDRARFLAGRGLLWSGRIEDGIPADDGDRWSGRGRALDRMRRSLLERIAEGLPRREADLAASVLLGERGSRDRDMRSAFGRLGLAHLFAVSGLHVGILLAVLAALVRPLAPGPGLRLLPALVVLPAYTVLTGMSASVLRASGLALLVLCAPVCGRRPRPLHLLGLLFWLNVQAAPWSVLDSGCRLSYLAASGIVCLHRVSGPALRALPRALRGVAGGLAVTLGAQWFTLPEVIASFGWLNLLAPLLNLVAVPVFGLGVWLCVLGLLCGAIWAWAGEALLALCWLLLRSLSAGAAIGARLSGAVLGLAPPDPARTVALLSLSAALGAALAGVEGRRGLWRPVLPLGGILLLLGSGGMGTPTRPAAVQFDVGQGDCALVVMPDGWRVLVDTGGAWRGGSELSWSVLPWLQRQGIRRLDAVVLTHAHADHTGGVATLAGRIEVGRWVLGGSLEAADLSAAPGPTEHPAPGAILHACGSWRLRCLHPAPAADADLGENDRSLTLILEEAGRPRGLWSGDVEAAGEERLLARERAAAGAPVPVWKAGHHGSATSGSPAWLQRWRPGLVLISCGLENRHHHPSHGPYLAHGDTLTTLRTDLDGSIRLDWEADGGVAWRATSGRRGRVAGSGGAP